MKVYSLTPWGWRIARSVNTPDTPQWRIVHYLDRVRAATTEQICENTKLSVYQAEIALRGLLKGRVVTIVGGRYGYSERGQKH